jgi:hypothetical protein
VPGLAAAHVHERGREDPEGALDVQVPVVLARPHLVAEAPEVRVLAAGLAAPFDAVLDVLRDGVAAGALVVLLLFGVGERGHWSSPSSS